MTTDILRPHYPPRSIGAALGDLAAWLNEKAARCEQAANLLFEQATPNNEPARVVRDMLFRLRDDFRALSKQVGGAT